jgi:hypothetical protein
MDDPNFTGNDLAVGKARFEVLCLRRERDSVTAGNRAQQ